jgi:hypothetical protein
MTLHSSQNEAWRCQPDTVAAIIVRAPETNCSPLAHPIHCFQDDKNNGSHRHLDRDDGDYQELFGLISSATSHDLNILETWSALAEMNSILSAGLRYSFDIYRAGGNSSVDGATPPGMADFSPGVGAWLVKTKQSQTAIISHLR